jgi:glutaredoxin
MRTITLYAKAGCHLCDEAREALEAALSDLRDRRASGADPSSAEADDLALDEVDIRRDPALFERYRYRIPVIAVDGKERLEGRITADEIDDLVRSLA